MPAMHLVEIAPARDGRNLSGSSVSSETLMRRTPQSRQSRGILASCVPLVVSVSSSSAPEREVPRQRANSVMMPRAHQRLAAGQAQLAHALGDEGGAQPVELLEREQVAPWAGRSCAPTCNRRSGSRSGRSPRRADRRWRGQTDRSAPLGGCAVEFECLHVVHRFR